jgi:hypothetical protein
LITKIVFNELVHLPPWSGTPRVAKGDQEPGTQFSATSLCHAHWYHAFQRKSARGRSARASCALATGPHGAKFGGATSPGSAADDLAMKVLTTYLNLAEEVCLLRQLLAQECS